MSADHLSDKARNRAGHKVSVLAGRKVIEEDNIVEERATFERHGGDFARSKVLEKVLVTAESFGICGSSHAYVDGASDTDKAENGKHKGEANVFHNGASGDQYSSLCLTCERSHQSRQLFRNNLIFHRMLGMSCQPYGTPQVG